MPKVDLAIGFRCPKCPKPLVYITSTASVPEGQLDTHIYRCPEHGGAIPAERPNRAAFVYELACGR